MSDCVIDISDQIKTQAIDQLKFGNLSPRLEKISLQKSNLLDLKNLEYKPFPLNSSSKTSEELHAIKLVQSTSPEWHEGKFKDKIDKNFLSIYTEYLDNLGLDYNLNYIKNVIEDLAPAILQLKKLYNRPRPEQVSEYHGIKIFTDPTSTAKTPAYPSGHSLQAKVIEAILSREHPDHINIFKSITDRVSLARILRGLHYHSDIEFSYFIFNKYLKEKV